MEIDDSSSVTNHRNARRRLLSALRGGDSVSGEQEGKGTATGDNRARDNDARTGREPDIEPAIAINKSGRKTLFMACRCNKFAPNAVANS